MKRTLIRYKAKPDRADENEALIRNVFKELHEKAPEGGTRYAVLRLADGSFVHIVHSEEGEGASGLVVSVSHDGGLTWADPSIVQLDGVAADGSHVPTTFFNDKEWIGVDPIRGDGLRNRRVRALARPAARAHARRVGGADRVRAVGRAGDGLPRPWRHREPRVTA